MANGWLGFLACLLIISRITCPPVEKEPIKPKPSDSSPPNPASTNDPVWFPNIHPKVSQIVLYFVFLAYGSRIPSLLAGSCKCFGNRREFQKNDWKRECWRYKIGQDCRPSWCRQSHIAVEIGWTETSRNRPFDWAHRQKSQTVYVATLSNRSVWS